MDTSRVSLDVIQCIIDLVQDTPTLLALVLVCHDVKIVAERSLWRSLTLRFDDQRSVDRCALAADDPRGAYVREFCLSLPYTRLPRRTPAEGAVYDTEAPLIGTVLSTLERLLPSISNTTTVKIDTRGMNISDAGAVCDAFAIEGRVPHMAVIVIDHQTSLGLRYILDTHPSILSVQIRARVSFSDLAPMSGEPGATACHQCSKKEPARRNGKLIPSLVVEEADDYKIAGSLLDGSIKPHAPPVFVCLSFTVWESAYLPMVRNMSSARVLHLAVWAPPLEVVDAIARLPYLEEFFWSRGATTRAQREIFARDARGELSHSLRKLRFVSRVAIDSFCYHSYVKNLPSRQWLTETQTMFEASELQVPLHS